MAGLLALVAVAATLSACTSSDEATDPPAVDPANSALTHLRAQSDTTGGTLRAVAGTPDAFDPARSYYPWVWNLMRLYNRTLVTYAAAPGADGAELVPDLAQDLGTVSPDQRTWTFTLKPGLFFDDGKPITSRDLKYAIERSFAADVIVGGPTYVVDLLDDPADPYPGPYQDAGPDRLSLPSVATPDDRTIVFSLNRPFADFRHVLALPSSAPVPAARDTVATYGDHPASSGPYVITSMDPVTGMVLERNPHWDPATDEVRTALPDRVEVRIGMTSLERDQAVLSGAADVDLTATGVHPQTEARVRSEPDLAARADNPTNGVTRMLALPVNQPPFDNPECRKAVALAVDRDEVAEALGGVDHAEPVAQLWPSTVPGGPTREVPAIDTRAAGDALTACGQPTGLDVTFVVPNQPTDLQVAAAVKEALAKSGIDATVQGLDPQNYYSVGIGTPQVVTTNGYHVLSTLWSADYPAPSAFLSRLADSRQVRPTGNANYAMIQSPQVDAMIDAARASADPVAVTQAWQGVEQAVADIGGYVPLVEDRVLVVSSERLRNAVISAAYPGYDLAVVGVRAP